MLPSTMVKFFTQSCPRCLSKPSSLCDEKCLCFVKGHIVAANVAARGYVDDKKPTKKEGASGSSTIDKTEEQLIIENTKKALEALRNSQKTQKKPEDLPKKED